MADGKREHEYDVAIQTITYLTQALNGKFRPNNSNPIRNQHAQFVEKVDDKGKEALALLGAGLRLFCLGNDNGSR